MSYKVPTFVVVVVAGALPMFHSGGASAAALSFEETSGGTTNFHKSTTYTSPISDTYGNTFLSPTNVFTSQGGVQYGFYDDFVFTVPASSVDSVTSTINFGNVLGVNNLQVRLYNESGNANLPVLGAPSGGAIDAWSTTTNVAPGTNLTVDALAPTMLTAGTYVLEVRGDVVGSGGGSYSGTLNVVPLPAALPLLLSGLGLLGGAVRRSAGTSRR